MVVAGSIRCANTTSPLPFGTKRGRILRSDETENKPAHRPISLPPDGLHFVACAPRENESGKNLAGESFAVGQEEEEVSEREKDSFYAFLDNLAGLHPFGFRATSVGKLGKVLPQTKVSFLNRQPQRRYTAASQRGRRRWKSWSSWRDLLVFPLDFSLFSQEFFFACFFLLFLCCFVTASRQAARTNDIPVVGSCWSTI